MTKTQLLPETDPAVKQPPCPTWCSTDHAKDSLTNVRIHQHRIGSVPALGAETGVTLARLDLYMPEGTWGPAKWDVNPTGISISWLPISGDARARSFDGSDLPAVLTVVEVLNPDVADLIRGAAAIAGIPCPEPTEESTS